MERPDPNIFPNIKIINIGRKAIDFLFHAPNPEGYPSDYRFVAEPTDGEALEPNLNAIGEVSDQLRFEGV